MVGAVTEVIRSPLSMERWMLTLQEGNMAGREDIFAAAVDMSLERPLFGWQPFQSFYALGQRLGVPTGRDPHNLFLSLMLEVGIVGTLPFLVGLYFCGRSAWRARLGNFRLLPLALLLVLVTAGLSGTTIVWKTQWLLFALILSAGSTSPIRQSKATFPSPIYYR